MIYFTSDTHFGHANIIKYCGRPWDTAEEHDAELIRRWNETVSPQDTVYHLGDFFFYRNLLQAEMVIKQLNGSICWVKGNHDKSKEIKKLEHLFQWTKDYYELKAADRKIILFHYPIMSWRNFASWFLASTWSLSWYSI